MRTSCGLRGDGESVSLRRAMRWAVAMLAAATALVAAPAHASVTAKPWPPASGEGTLFVHYGEEHWNDADGLTLLPKVVRGVGALQARAGHHVRRQGQRRHRRAAGAAGSRSCPPYDRLGIPYFPAVGNHDRKTPPGVRPGHRRPAHPRRAGRPGQLQAGVRRPARSRLATRRPIDAGFGPRARAADDPAGAASHYFVDYKDRAGGSSWTTRAGA